MRRKGAIIRHEMGLYAHRRRIDIALLTPTRLEGYEIKSDADSLARLHEQATDYQRTFHRLTLVTTAKHRDRAAEILPPIWGIILATQTPTGKIRLTTWRKADENTGTDPMATAQLLWREEALDELRARGLATGMSKLARHYIWKKLAEEVPPKELKAVALNRLHARSQANQWKSGAIADHQQSKHPEAPP